MAFAFCIKIHGKKHCFPLQAETPKLPGIGPINFPALELATTILTVAPHLKDGDAAFGKELTTIARRFVDGVKGGLPQGVELEEFKS